MTIGARRDFGRDWNEVVKSWCLGSSLPVPPEKAWEALEALEQIWPEYLGDVLTRGQKGYFIMASVIENGLTLATCQKLRGFQGVLSRIKDGNQSAVPEVRLAAALVHLGYQPVLDENHKGQKPDLLIRSEGQEVFIDVISPHMSDDTKQAETLASTLAQEVLPKLTMLTARSHLEIYLLASSLSDISDTVTDFLNIPSLAPSETVYTIPDIALIKYSKVTNVTNLGPTIPVDTEFPVIFVGKGFITGSSVNSVTVRLPFTDERLELLIHRKQNQFTKDEINLMVIDLENVPYGYKRWPSLARRRLQPRMNRRFSGIALFHQSFDLDTRTFIKACHLEDHPSPYKGLPSSLRNDLTKLSSITL